MCFLSKLYEIVAQILGVKSSSNDNKENRLKERLEATKAVDGDLGSSHVSESRFWIQKGQTEPKESGVRRTRKVISIFEKASNYILEP